MSKQSMGGQARAAKLSPEDRSRIASEAARKRWSRRGQVVYVIGPEVGPQKIGISHDPEVRLKDLRKVSGPAALSVVMAVDPGDKSPAEIEMRAHWILREQRLEGEWFDATREEAVAAVNQALEEATAGAAQTTDEPSVAFTFRLHESVLRWIKEKYGRTWRLQLQHMITDEVRSGRFDDADVTPRPKVTPMKPPPVPYGSRLKKR